MIIVQNKSIFTQFYWQVLLKLEKLGKHCLGECFSVQGVETTNQGLRGMFFVTNSTLSLPVLYLKKLLFCSPKRDSYKNLNWKQLKVSAWLKFSGWNLLAVSIIFETFNSSVFTSPFLPIDNQTNNEMKMSAEGN